MSVIFRWPLYTVARYIGLSVMYGCPLYRVSGRVSVIYGCPLYTAVRYIGCPLCRVPVRHGCPLYTVVRYIRYI